MLCVTARPSILPVKPLAKAPVVINHSCLNIGGICISSTGSSGQCCDDLDGWDGELGGTSKRDVYMYICIYIYVYVYMCVYIHICIPIADLLCCTAETNTNIIKQLYSNNKIKCWLLSRIQFFVTLWTVASLPMGFSRQECWSGLPFPTPGDVPDPGIKPGQVFCIVGIFFTV